MNTSNIAKWNGSTWSALGSGVNMEVLGMAMDASGNLYVGEGVNTLPVYGSPSPNSIAEWNGVNWSTLGSGIVGSKPGDPLSPDVSCLVFDRSGNLYVGGAFSTAGTNAAANIAKALLVGPTPNQLTLAQPGPSTNVITYLGTPGNSYALDAATDLTAPIDWIPQTTNVASTNNATTAGYLTFTNLSAAPQAFYRIRSVP